MAVQLLDLEIIPDLTISSAAHRQLIGNVFTKMTLNATIEVHTYALSTATNKIDFAPQTYPDNSYIKSATNSPIFKDFRSGDTILIQNAANPANNGPFTIVNKISDSIIRISITGLVVESSTTADIYLIKTYDSVDFYYNLIENNANISYASLTDGNIQKYSANSGLSTVKPLVGQGYKSWQLGSGTVQRVSVDATGRNIFDITQEFYINPFFLFTQSSTTAPNYFLNNNCLRHIFKFEAKPTQADTSRVQTLEFNSEIGNTGWFNENYNTGITNYFIDNLVYKRLDTNAVVSGILFSDTVATEVSFSIKNTVDSPFTTLSQVAANFINVPQVATEFQSNQSTMDENFSFDRVLTTAGVAPVAGDFARAIQNYSVSYISATELQVTFEILLNASAFALISQKTDKKYLLAVYTKKRLTPWDVTDTVTLLLDYKDFYIDLGVDGLFTQSEFGFIEHYNNDNTSLAPDVDFFKEDELVAYSRILLDTSVSNYTVSMKSITSKIIAKNGANEFTLKSYSAPLLNKPVVSGIEYFTETQTIPFKAPATDIITQFKVSRDMVADASPLHYFDIYTPFLNRWEYWVANLNVSSLLFDINEPNDGLNNDWEYFNSFVGWNVYHQLTITATVDGILQNFNFTNELEVFDYNSNPDWDNEDIKTYDLSNNQLISGLDEFILGYSNTNVVCEFEYVGGSPPLITEVEILMRVEPKENGGEFGSTRISSVRASGSETQWTVLSGALVVTKSKVGNVYYGEAYLDNTKLSQNFSEYDITARIYDKRALEVGRLLEDSSFRLLEDNGKRLLEDQ